MSTVKLRTTDKPKKSDKLKSGLPGSPEEQRAKIKAAIAANRETLRRLASSAASGDDLPRAGRLLRDRRRAVGHGPERITLITANLRHFGRAPISP